MADSYPLTAGNSLSITPAWPATGESVTYACDDNAHWDAGSHTWSLATTPADGGTTRQVTFSATCGGVTITKTTTIAISPSASGNFLLTSNYADDTVSLFDSTDPLAPVLTKIIAVGHQPSRLAIHPNGFLALVPNYGDGTLTLIDLRDRSNPVTSAYALPAGVVPYQVAISHNGRVAYICDARAGRGGIIPVSLADPFAPAIYPEVFVSDAQDSPGGLAITPDDSCLLLAAFTCQTIYSFSLANPLYPIQIADAQSLQSTYQLAISRSGQFAVGVSTNNKLAYINLTNPLAPATLLPGVTITGMPYGVAIVPDDTWALVPQSGSNTVTAVDLTVPSSPEVSDPAVVGAGPFWVAVSPDGKSGYVVLNISGKLVPLDLSTRLAPVPKTGVYSGAQCCSVAIYSR